jgi:hypothetical protein
MTEPIERIYFDTSALEYGEWPGPNTLLADIFKSAGDDLGIGLFIPEAVEIEMENRFLKRLYTAARGILPEGVLEEIQSHYKRTHESLKKERGINAESSVPMPTNTLADEFRGTVPLVAPFEGRRGPFRDRIIYLSVVEHLQHHAAVSIIVSDDNDFKEFASAEERRWREGLGVSLRILHQENHQSLSLLWQELLALQEGGANEELRKWRAEDRARAKAAVEEKPEDELIAFIEGNLRVSPLFPFRIESASITSAKVANVTTTATPDTPGGAQVDLTAEVKIDISGVALERVSTPTFAPGKGVASLKGIYSAARFGGGAAPVLRGHHSRPFMIGGGEWMTLVRLLSGMALVTAKATFHPDRYEGVEFKSATLSSWDR